MKIRFVILCTLMMASTAIASISPPKFDQLPKSAEKKPNKWNELRKFMDDLQKCPVCGRVR